MASSPVVNVSLTLSPQPGALSSSCRVVRYTALVSGIAYGITHRRTLQKRLDAAAEKAEYKRKEELIAKAKEAYKNRLLAQQSGGNGVISDPEDPRFDLEKWIAQFDK
ncbi:F1F0 ATP synthase subunit e, mitochondrial [Tilletia horrida]|uniref:ATP synthase F(0) complex subunit e, mitochondrial n=1 Tax=Tilletia horrida TaxID=155126 RepID=A0AAN6GKX4_9BASI|nr:F1F0 ATP synthase subunit e, mitochondrial [Tilletia horrida]KAK0551338.1 F1F0 ATP synthase subunit e, mitochondrial [Tilletia horrida]